MLETMDKPKEKIKDAPKEVEEQLIVPKISLHALFGVATRRTMQVTGVIQGRQLHILIDSGSIQNFVCLKFAKQMECCKTLAPTFQVMVVNRERLQCDEIYLAILVEIQGCQS